MIDLNKEKTRFITELESNNQSDKDVIAAVTLGITHLVESHRTNHELPIVVCAHNPSKLEKTLELLQSFYRRIHPSTPEHEPYLSPNALTLTTSPVAGNSTEQSLIDYCHQLRDYGPSLFYWADSKSWFKHMPPEMFYVIDFNGTHVVGGMNNCVHVTAADVTKDSEPVEDVHMQYYQEADAGIIRVITAPEGEMFDSIITINSPQWQKEACVALRRYLGRECNYGMSWDSSDVGWKNVKVHPLIQRHFQLPNSNNTSQGLIGMLLFDEDSGNCFLSAAWVHPFFRRKGHLERIWPSLVARYGHFDVEDPSANMQKFLTKMGHLGKRLGSV